MATHSSILAWKIPGTEESGVAKKQTQLTTHTHLPSTIQPQTRTLTQTYIPIHITTHTHLLTVLTHIYMLSNIPAYPWMHVLTHSHICTCTYTHTHSHIHSHTSEHEASLVYNTLLLGLIKLSCHRILTTQSGSTVNPWNQGLRFCLPIFRV